MRDIKIIRIPVVFVLTLIFLLSCGDEKSAMQNTSINSDQTTDYITDNTSQQYYVAQSGDDINGNGTLARPWKSINHAIGAIPTDQRVTVNLRAGTYSLANALLIENRSNTGQENVLVIQSYQNENASLDGSLIAEFGAMISISNSAYITLNDLELTNLVGNKSGIHVTGASSNITITNNTIHNMHWTTDIDAANNPAPSDNLNPVVIVGDSQTAMSNISVQNNKLYNLTTGYSEAIKVTGNIDGFLVADNEVHDITNIGIVAAGNYAWVGLDDETLNQARNGTIRDNEVYRCVSPVAASAGIYVDGGRDIVVSNNFSHHNTVGFSVGSEQPGETSTIVLSDNVSADNVQAGVVIGTISPDSMVSDVTLNNNELRGNYTNPVWGGAPIIINKSKNISIRENTISSISQYMITVNAASNNLNLNNNSYESITVPADQSIFSWLGINNQNYTGFDNYRSATGQDSQSTFVHAGNNALTTFINYFKNILRK